ncbi:AraC family transcriptional regulator [Aliifodinibius sp. S!AR15-10]|uniref:AraC family transcriptional regulator n=1 Tax=Aliifodinibius sp. S!AR15-10 TaxID=2950437 RepID=UPI00285DD1EC|nr:AraC family transcriptional regulator [Aliifodinibius sp. S!AR15-10]MDR8392719.1 AraC family transcriptional regulator [Aliifodinibius sp. S!AR15-10]
MDAKLLKRSVNQNRSFVVEQHSYKNFLKVWHYHPEIELVVILESSGTRFVGDSIEKFKPGEIVLIGKNLPHLWLNEDKYFENNSELKAKAHVIRFYDSFVTKFLSIPEMKALRDLFKRSKRGIKFEGDSNSEVQHSVNSLFNLHGLKRIKVLLDILDSLASQNQYKLLSSAGFVSSFENEKESKILRVYEYVMQNFKEDISLDEAAGIVNMNPSAFSRYFKKTQKKTFSQFLKEVKIGYACKLLLEQTYNVSEVCYRSGFNNISNFNRQFKSEKKMTPTQYVKKHTEAIKGVRNEIL